MTTLLIAAETTAQVGVCWLSSRSPANPRPPAVRAGAAPDELACTATTDRHQFAPMTDIPAAVYGRHAPPIHGIDEVVTFGSLVRDAATMARFIVDRCGVKPVENPTKERA